MHRTKTPGNNSAANLTWNNIYQENGYKSRMDYLTCLAEDYGCPLENVLALADILGEVEDFDGLVTALGDYYG